MSSIRATLSSWLEEAGEQLTEKSSIGHSRRPVALCFLGRTLKFVLQTWFASSESEPGQREFSVEGEPFAPWLPGAGYAGKESLTNVTFGPSVTDEMQEEIGRLEARVEALEEEVEVLKTAVGREEVVVLRTLSREEARQEIVEMFQSGETLFYSDVARRLRLDLALVVELCNELEGEEAIEVDADVH